MIMRILNIIDSQAHATSLGLNVEVTEPDASPLALQGPKSLDLVRDLFGDKVNVDALKYFWYVHHPHHDLPIFLILRFVV